MKNFKNKLQVFFKILICASFSTIQTNIVGSKAQMIANVSDATLGIESVGSPSLRVLKLKRTVYVGECPGVRNKQLLVILWIMRLLFNLAMRLLCKISQED